MSKLKTIEELERIRYAAKKLGKNFIFTNGCFDLLHVGHIRNLHDAKQLGGILAVAINSDESLKKLKKLRTSITSQDERAEILSAFSAVDYVVIFDEPTADGIILRLKPDIHAKGTDYTVETVPERESVLSYGGKIVITGDPKSHSTRDIIKKIRNDV
ncbi:MAG TPA: adenylyltransferase/cytidyltransferase family protein [Candidatus Wallbacteria bacterium]|nr:adenylyltransferase/cytidyltransferase family protein [Candidatus Wallbacteria bacterium]